MLRRTADGWRLPVRKLLKEMLEAGTNPEEVCRGRPQLLPEVRERLREFRLIDTTHMELLPGLESEPEVGVVTPEPVFHSGMRPSPIGGSSSAHAQFAVAPGRNLRMVPLPKKGAYWFRLLIFDSGRMPRKPGWPR
jgi:hypothetical protein